MARDNPDPVFNASFMWLVRRPRSASLEIEVRHRGPMGMDRLIGQAVVKIEEYLGEERANRTWEVEMALVGKSQDEGQGFITFKMSQEQSNGKGWCNNVMSKE
ncbi:hypothetical protein HK104_000963 [Borealophlyctis nickersoniae]|nr:hypothetical protein HK104_000963 [Borealophlyctis nickersoniae]